MDGTHFRGVDEQLRIDQVHGVVRRDVHHDEAGAGLDVGQRLAVQGRVVGDTPAVVVDHDGSIDDGDGEPGAHVRDVADHEVEAVELVLHDLADGLAVDRDELVLVDLKRVCGHAEDGVAPVVRCSAGEVQLGGLHGVDAAVRGVLERALKGLEEDVVRRLVVHRAPRPVELRHTGVRRDPHVGPDLRGELHVRLHFGFARGRWAVVGRTGRTRRWGVAVAMMPTFLDVL